MKTFKDLIQECLTQVKEVFPWDVADMHTQGRAPLLLDIREPYEYNEAHIEHSLNVPRGILEPACEYDYDETVAELVEAREREIVVICRSGNRSILAAHTMQRMGYCAVYSLKTGVRGWNDYDLPLYDQQHTRVDPDTVEAMLAPARQRPPANLLL